MKTNQFTSFGLTDDIVRSLTELHVTEPTDVQTKVIPLALEMKDLIVTSQTGTGKTASFAIPICELINWEENKPQALILTPTRELAAQIKEDITNIGRFKRIKATLLYGQEPFSKQKLELKQKSHVVIGTPGRVYDHIMKGTLPLDKIQHLVIDEADNMLNMGFIDQVEQIITRLPKERVTSIYSATIGDDIKRLSETYMRNPVHISISEDAVTSENIAQSIMKVSEEDKLPLLKDVTTVENPDSCLIFCNTQENVDLLEEQLEKAGYRCGKIHGALAQKERFTVMNAFKRGKFRYLIATNVAARGIDIDSVSLVINYDFPFEKESYVHRTGRTGRAGKSGKAISFATDYEKDAIRHLEKYTGSKIPVVTPPSPAEVAAAQDAFDKKMNVMPTLKEDKNVQLNKDIMTLFFNGGKKKKLRAVDFVGTLTSIDGITADDIGIIAIKETSTYIDILNGKGQLALEEMRSRSVKGKKLKVHKSGK